MKKVKFIFMALTMMFAVSATAQVTELANAKEWPDNNGKHINAHGGGVIKYGDQKRQSLFVVFSLEQRRGGYARLHAGVSSSLRK